VGGGAFEDLAHPDDRHCARAGLGPRDEAEPCPTEMRVVRPEGCVRAWRSSAARCRAGMSSPICATSPSAARWTAPSARSSKRRRGTRLGASRLSCRRRERSRAARNRGAQAPPAGSGARVEGGSLVS
jgi:hypothetical protein